MITPKNLSNEEYHALKGVSASDFRLLEKSPLHLENKNLFKLVGETFVLGSLVHKMVLEPDEIGAEFVCADFDGADINTNTLAFKEAEPLLGSMDADTDYKRFFIKEDFEHINASKNSKLYKESKATFYSHCEANNLTVVRQEVWELAHCYREAQEFIGTRELVSPSVWATAQRMADNVLRIAGPLLKRGQAEQSFVVEDRANNVVRKCRPDYYREDIGVVIDLKTTADGSSRGFSKSIHDYAYHRQAAWYLDTLDMAEVKVSRFVFITVESNAPHMVDVWEIDPVSVEKGRNQYLHLLKERKAYIELGRLDVVKSISLPAWAFKDE